MTAATAGTGPPEPLSERFPERVLPRDGIDWLLAIPLAAWIWSLFLFAPLFLILFSLEALGVRENVAVPLAIFGGLAVLIDVFLLIWLPAFRSVTVDRDGLLFRRYAGPDKRVPWASVTRVRPAKRREIFRRVWLWPGVPPRGSVMCGSTLNQLRLEWSESHQRRTYYFAPADRSGFLTAFSRSRPDLVAGLVSPGE